VAGAYGWQPYHLHVLIVLKSGSLNLLEPSGPVQACNGTALPYTVTDKQDEVHNLEHYYILFKKSDRMEPRNV
jgi:hypothetical protein